MAGAGGTSWRQQPRIVSGLDYDNPIARAFDVGILPGVAPKGVGRRPVTFAPNFSTTVLPQQGRVLDLSINTQATITPAFFPTPTYPFKVVWAGRLTNTSIGVYFSLGSSGGGIGGSWWYLGGGSSTAVAYGIRNNYAAGGGPGVNVPGGSAVGVEMVIVCQSLSATDHRICVNGSSVVVDTGNADPFVAWDQMRFGDSGGPNASHCSAVLMGSGGVILTDAQMVELSRRPENIWALFAPAAKERRAATAAGGGATVTCSGIPSAEAFGTATVTRRAAVTATGVPSAEAFGTAAVTRRATVTTTGVPSAEAFGAHTLVRRTSSTVTATGIASAEAFGAHVLLRASVRGVATAGIASAEAFGAHVLLRASVRGVTATGIASAEAFGAHSVTRRQGVVCTGIASAQAFGVAVLTRNGVAPPASGKVSRVNMRLGLSL